MESIYTDGTYSTKNYDWHQEDSIWKAIQVARLLKYADMPIKTISDVGCGAGLVLLELARMVGGCTTLHGFDMSPEAIQLARKNKQGTCYVDLPAEFTCGEIFDQDDRYDLVLCLDVVEHIEDYFGFLRRLSSRGRMFAFHIPLEMTVLHVLWNHHSKRRQDVGHLHYFSEMTAILALKETGYNIVHQNYTKTGTEIPVVWRDPVKIGLQIPRRITYWMSPQLSVRLFGGCSLLILAKPAEL